MYRSKPAPWRERLMQKILDHLAAHPKGCWAVEIAEEVGYPTSTVVRCLKRLQRGDKVFSTLVFKNGNWAHRWFFRDPQDDIPF